MKKTIIIHHETDYSSDLIKAKQVADWAVQNKFQTSSKYVSHIGLPSVIANQILRKYGNNKEIKEVKNIKLTVPRNGKGIRILDTHTIYVPCLKTEIHCWFDLSKVKHIDQIEADNDRYYVTFDVEEEPVYEPVGFLGVDLNATGHSVVVASGAKILKRGKRSAHIKKKYGCIRRKLQKQ